MKGITMWEMSAKYNQDSDSLDDDNSGQTIKIMSVNAGGGNYIVIETKRWAFDNADELKKLIDDFVAKTKTGIRGES